MKLLRYGDKGKERPGMLDPQGRIRDLGGVASDFTGAGLSPQALERIRGLNPNSLPVIDPGVRIGPCVGAVGKFIGIGLNYSDHAAEAGMALPAEPIFFLKATSCINGPNDPIEIPRDSVKTDWEVELGVVIGTPGKYLEPDRALDHVAGYCVVNDVSEREFQLERGSQWVKGKSADTFGPIGPYLVSTDEVIDPQNLNLWLSIDGVERQRGNTRTMVFSVLEVLCYVSRFMSLQPGDVITTGTPPGVGMGCRPPQYLRPGMTLSLGIDGLGEQNARVVQGD